MRFVARSIVGRLLVHGIYEDNESVPHGRSFDVPKDELIIQLLKIALGLAIGAYFVWWSLEVLRRLPVH